jgi:hypothetical protein
MPITPEVRAILDQTVAEWAEKFKNQLVKRLRKKESSGSLTNSMRYQIHRHAENEVGELLFYFQTHGRWLDMRQMQPAKGGKAYIEEIVAWMHQKGIANDMIAQWWIHNNGRKVPADIERRIAWGIMKAQIRKRKRWKWYNSSKTAALNELNTRVLFALSGASLQDIRDGLFTKK